MRIAVAGTGMLAVNMLNALLESEHQIVAIIQNGRLTKGYRRKLLPRFGGLLFARHTVTGIARLHDIPILFIDKMTEEELAPLRALEPDLILVGGFGIILKEPIIRLPRLGCLNTHSALLPRHRGPNPFTAVLLANEPETGVTFHVIDPGIDTGDIVAQYSMPIQKRHTAGLVYRETSRLAGEHILEVLDKIESEGLHGTPQDAALATYDKKMPVEEAFIRWDRPAEEIDRLVRACVPFQVARFRLNGRVVFVYRMKFDPTPVDAAPGTVVQRKPRIKVATGLGTVTLLHAYTLKPVPWFWPAPWNRPRVGRRME